jgi:hypothetical protein
LTFALARYHGDQRESGLGCAVARGGDINGTGHDAILAGAFQESTGDFRVNGAAFVIDTTVPGRHSIADAYSFKLYGGQNVHNLGYSLGGAGDYNHDGYADLLVGAPSQWCAQHPNSPGSACLPNLTDPSVENQANAGDVYVVLGGRNRLHGDMAAPSADISVHGEEALGMFGFSVAWTQATDDSSADFVVGAPGESRAYFYPGPINNAGMAMAVGDHQASDAFAIYEGEGEETYAGYSVAGVNLHGFWVPGKPKPTGDIVIGAPGQMWFEDGAQPRPGRVYGFNTEAN